MTHLVGNALLTLSGESSDNSSLGHTSAFDLSETWSRNELASLSVLSEVSDDSALHVPANGS